MSENPQVIKEVCDIVDARHEWGNRYRICVKSNQIAPLVRAGQCVSVSAPGMGARMLPYRFTVRDVDYANNVIDVIYHVFNFTTGALPRVRAGETIPVSGPYGEGWAVPEGAARVLVISEDAGAFRVLQLARELAEAGTKVRLVAVAPSERAVESAMEYAQEHGLEAEIVVRGATPAVEALPAALAAELDAAAFDAVACCAPDAVNQAAAAVAQAAGVAFVCALDQE